MDFSASASLLFLTHHRSIPQEDDSKRREERERAQIERRYTLPDNPAILVHPNPAAKAGKFDCTVMSLSVLLDYRPEDNKEHSFEVRFFVFWGFLSSLQIQNIVGQIKQARYC